MDIVITYDVETERTRVIHGFLSNISNLEWEQNSVFKGDISTEDYDAIQQWCEEFKESDEEITIYNMSDNNTVTFDSSQNSDDEPTFMTDISGSDDDSDDGSDENSGAFPVEALALDSIRERNSRVDERLSYFESELQDARKDSDMLESIRDALSLDDDQSALEAVETLQDHVGNATNDGNDDNASDGSDDGGSTKVPVNDVADGESNANQRDGIDVKGEFL